MIQVQPGVSETVDDCGERSAATAAAVEGSPGLIRNPLTVHHRIQIIQKGKTLRRQKTVFYLFSILAPSSEESCFP